MKYLGIRLTIKMAVLSKLICRFSTSRKKIVAGSLQKLTKQILKFVGKCKGPRIAEQQCEQLRLRPLQRRRGWGLEVQGRAAWLALGRLLPVAEAGEADRGGRGGQGRPRDPAEALIPFVRLHLVADHLPAAHLVGRIYP